jgi:hypothetical protein
MTMPEFWQHMAEHNPDNPDNDAGKELEDFANEVAKEQELETKRLRDDALKIIQHAITEWNSVEPNDPNNFPMAVELVEVLDASYSGMWNHTDVIEATFKFDDDTTRTIRYTYQYWAGSRIDPPDEDTNLEWVVENA